MSLLSSIKKAIEFFIKDLKKSQNYKKGKRFENFVRERLFPKSDYKMFHRSHDYAHNEDFIENTIDPDFGFQCLLTDLRFYVEAKYRTKFTFSGRLLIYRRDKKQLQRHRELNQEKPVFVCLGVGGKPDSPKHVFMVPLNYIQSHYLTRDVLNKFSVSANQTIHPKKVWSLIDKYAYCIRCKKSIQLNRLKPLCADCYQEWKQYANYQYSEKYCHACGKSDKVTFVKPFCHSCYDEITNRANYLPSR